MAQCQQPLQLLFRQRAVIALLHAHGDGIEPGLAHNPPGDGGIRQPDAQDLAAAEHRLFLFRHANDRGRHIADQDHFAHHVRFIGEELPARVRVQHHHLRPARQLFGVEGGAFAEGHAVDVKVIAAHAVSAGRHVDIAVAQTQVLRDRRRGGVHPRLLLDGRQIVILQRLLILRLVVAKVFAGINVDGVGADSANIRQHQLLGRVAHHHYRHHRGNTDDDAEHGQQSAHFIGRHRQPGHGQRFTKAAGELSPAGRSRQRFLRCRRSGLARRRVAHQLTVADLDNAFSLGRHLRIVGNDNHRVALIAQLMQDRHHLFAGMAVERSGRFIREDHLPAVHQRTGNTYALLLAAGQLRRLVIHPLRQPQTR